MAEVPVSRRLAAVMAADVVGYSRLMEHDEEGTLTALNGHLHGLIVPSIEVQRGRVVKTTGDGVLAEFASVVDAVRCAIKIQAEMADRNADTPVDRRIEFRIGINLGDVLVEEDDIFGDGVNVAARLESLADPGGVCISGTVFDQVEGKLDHVFQDLGPQTVKNIAKPIRVYRVRLEGGGARPAAADGKAQPALPDKASIAVLPFDNLSRDPEQESFSDGLTESLITTLSKAPGLFVIARSSSFVYKGKSVSVQEVARDLGVAFVLEGSIQRLGNRMRINAQLIDGQSGHHVWAERYDRTTDDLFLLQDDITFNILTACQVQLTEGEPAKLLLDRGGQPNLAAIELHWQAMEKFRSYTQADNAAARSLWERCLAMDEPDATRLAMLGYTHVMDAKSNWSEDRKASIAKAEDVAAEAETLNSRNVTAKTLRANIAQLRKEFDEAVELARQAVEIEPGSADSQYVLGIMLNYAGQPEQAIGAMGKAMRLSPFYPTSYLYQLGISKFLLRQHDQANDIFERCRQRNPNSRSNYVWMATVNAEAGNEAAASVCARQAMDLDPELTVGSWIATEPFKERDVIRRIITAMQRAGFRDE